ncbi:putative mitochondrial protein, partial [Mucuna pruriens]
MSIRDEFPDEQLLSITTLTPLFVDNCNFLATSQFPPKASRPYKEKIQSDAKHYIWDDPYLWSLYSAFRNPRSIRPSNYVTQPLEAVITDQLGLQGNGLYWPTIFRDAHQFVSTCATCQKAGMATSRRHEMPQQPILFCEVFDVWVSNGYSYILLAVDYVSRWVEVTASKTNDAKVVVDFLKSNIFYRFGVPKALISDQGSRFCNKAMASFL